MLGNLSDLDLRLIRVFMVIVEVGGVSAAQGALNVGQSTLSNQLATLETRLGYRLCSRGRGGFRLTPKGERFVQLARKLMGAVNDFGAQARSLDRQLVGTLRIGLIGHVASEKSLRLAQAIARFRQRDEAVRIALLARPPGCLEAQLISGQLQLALGYFWQRMPGLEYLPLFVERHRVYCGRGHPLFPRAGTLGMRELAGHAWAWRSDPAPQWRGLPPSASVTAMADDMESAAVLVLSGRHLGYLPEHLAAPYVAAGWMAAANPDRFHCDVEVQVATRRRARLDEPTLAFLEDLSAEAASSGARPAASAVTHQKCEPPRSSRVTASHA